MMSNKPGQISWQASFALDVLRLCAAFMVFFHHGYSLWFNNALSKKIIGLAHFSVVIFFVLSGYLIAYTTTINNRGGLKYAEARLGRLYSVMLPAILIAALCQLALFFVNPQYYAHIIRPPSIPRYLLSSVFMNEIWFFSSAPPIDGPLWSMCYEFWYYLIFGLWFFVKHPWKFGGVFIAICIAGPSVMTMMPIWIGGCLAYKIPQLTKGRGSWLLFIAAIITTVLLVQVLPALPYQLGLPPLHYANQFITDICIGAILAIGLSFITKIELTKPQPTFLKTFRKIADLTFPLYLLHYPLLVLWQSIFPNKQANMPQFIVTMAGVAAIIVVLGLFLESKRRWWNDLFGTIIKSCLTFVFGEKNKFRSI